MFLMLPHLGNLPLSKPLESLLICPGYGALLGRTDEFHSWCRCGAVSDSLPLPMLLENSDATLNYADDGLVALRTIFWHS